MGMPSLRNIRGARSSMVAALNHFISREVDRYQTFFKKLRMVEAGKLEWTPDCEADFQDLKKYLSKPPLLTIP